MLKKNLKLVVFVILTFMLLIFSGCSVDNEVVNSDIKNSENVINEELQENNVDKKLSEQEALDIGYDLYIYGIYPKYYDEKTNKIYLGKSMTEEKYEESITFDENYLGYPFGRNEDVENYFSEKRIKELEVQQEPYRIKKVEGVWYLGQPGVGSDFSYLGTVLTIKSLQENKIMFTATDYTSWDYIENGQSDFETYKDKKLYEYIEELESKYNVETEEHDFVIIKEDGNWKINEQVIAHY